MLKFTSKSTSGEVSIPRHLAIIMDGNGRWAKKRGLIRLMGHRQGAKAVRQTVENAARFGVSILTLFAFSSENWKRPPDEVNGLMNLFANVLNSERDRLHANGIKVSFIGDLTPFSSKLKNAIDELVTLTCNNQVMQLNIAVNYGGRWDITQACKALCLEVANNKLNIEDINEESIKQKLSIVDDVDLLIRTGGEMRVSNFLLYQIAYAELYVSECLWPDFDETELLNAFASFNKRERRFGMTSEQVSKL